MKKSWIVLLLTVFVITAAIFSESYLEVWFKIEIEYIQNDRWNRENMDIRADTAVKAIQLAFKKIRARGGRNIRVSGLKRHVKEIGPRRAPPDEKR